MKYPEKNQHNEKTIYMCTLWKEIQWFKKYERMWEKTNIMEKPCTCAYGENTFNDLRNMKKYEKKKHNGKTIYMWILWKEIQSFKKYERTWEKQT